VIERAVILARGGALEIDLRSAMPRRRSPTTADGSNAASEFFTESEMQQRDGKIFWRSSKKPVEIKRRDGAAELLGVKRTTLLSRVKRWG